MKTITLLFTLPVLLFGQLYGNDSTVVHQCRADFKYSFNRRVMCFAPCAPIQFSDNSSGEAVSWSWDFGDGNVSDEKHPFHIYTLLPDSNGIPFPEKIEVCLKVVFADGCTSDICKTISLLDDPGNCYLFFHPYPNDTIISIPELIQYSFDVEAPENTIQWFWDFGDGSVSDEPDPVHGYYFLGGLFKVCLTILTEDSCIQTYCTEIQVGPVDTIVNPDCQAGFTYNVMESYPPQYAFYDSSFGDPVSWFWDFGDGSYSEEPNPVHVFREMPVTDSLPSHWSVPPEYAYRVCLTIRTTSGCKSTLCQYVTAPYDTIVPEPDPCNYRIRLNTSNLLGIPCSGTASAGLFDPVYQRDKQASVYWSTGRTGSSVSGLCANMPYYVILTTAEGCRIAGSFAIMDYSVPVFPFGYWSYTGNENEHQFRYNPPDSTYRCYWEFENGTVLEGNEVTHNMSDENNEVELKVYDTGGNLVYREEIMIPGQATGVVEPAARAIRLYPNPVTDILHVEPGETGYGNASAVIYGIRGEKLLDIKNVGYADSSFRINVSDLPAGLYMIRLLSGDEVLGTGRFIKSD
jgi:hypothetical protein